MAARTNSSSSSIPPSSSNNHLPACITSRQRQQASFLRSATKLSCTRHTMAPRTNISSTL